MIIIRTFKDTDKTSVLKLWQETKPTVMTQGLLDIPTNMGLEELEFLYVAEKSGQIVGYCKVFYDNQQGWLYSVANCPQLSNKGIDLKLIQHATSQLKKRTQLQQTNLYDQKGPEQMREAK